MWPIAVIGFARPQYLEQTLTSLVNQKQRINGELEELAVERIALFQDGAVNQKSGERYAEDAEIAENVAVFRRIFPKGEVFQSPMNIGIAANVDRAERWMFDEVKADAGIFFEDDLVGNKYYLQSLCGMLDLALADERIGYVSCYGEHRMCLRLQEQTPTKYIPLVHHWGFGLTRRQYLLSKPYVDVYLELISKQDYLRPDLKEIFEMLDKWGMGPLLPAQDVIRGAICCKTGSVRLNTTACLGKYIGADGTHHTPRVYDRLRYGKTEVYPRPITTFPPLSDAQYEDFTARQDKWLRNDLTWHARQWMIGVGLAERNWPNFEVEFDRALGIVSNIDPQGRRRI